MKREKIISILLSSSVLFSTSFSSSEFNIANAQDNTASVNVSDNVDLDASQETNTTDKLTKINDSEIYSYSFENQNSDDTIINDISGKGDSSLSGNAKIVHDDTRGNVLSLPGGKNGTGGSLNLPSDLFKDVNGDTGFTISMWVKAAPKNENSGGWSRLFDAGSNEYKSDSAPYIFLSEGNGTDLNNGSAKSLSGFSVNDNKWTHIAFSVSKSHQTVYKNGAIVADDESNPEIFDEIENFTINSIGQSRFTADDDFKGLIDDVKFFNKSLTSSEISTVVGEDNDVSLNSCSVDNINAKFKNKKTDLLCEVDNPNTNYKPDDVKVIPSSKKATYKVVKMDGENNKFNIEITSANGMNTGNYTLSCLDTSNGAVLNYDITKTQGEIYHGSTGFLYGVSEANVPTMDLLNALHPKFLVQKAIDGLQHPTGDCARVAPALTSIGVENIQVYLQDSYLQWPYEFTGIDDYKEKVKTALHKLTDGKTEAEKSVYNYVLFNEPNSIWYSNNQEKFFKDWKTIYDLVKSIDPNARIAGPNNSCYDYDWYENFFKYCKENNCLPEIITWHELTGGDDENASVVSYKDHYNDIQRIINTYYADSNITPKIVINEYAQFENIGGPGSLVKWLSMFEETKVSACMAYWGLANTLNELSADANKPNGAFWVYKWYSDMKGNTVKLSTYNTLENGTYGLTSIDENNSTIYSLFGGQEGKQTVNINNISLTSKFTGASSVHVKLYKTKFTGHQGFLDAPSVEFDGNLPLQNGNLNIQVDDSNALDAYYAIITPSTGETSKLSDYNKVYTKTYESEDAELLGNAAISKKSGSGDLLSSNRCKVVNINDDNDGVIFDVNAPKDGNYKLNIYYGNKAPNVNPKSLEIQENGQNRAIGKIAKQTLTIDNDDSQIIDYDSTVKEDYISCKTIYVPLKAGNHKLKFTHYGENQSDVDPTIRLSANLDKIDLTFDSDLNKPLSPSTTKIEACEVLGNNNYTFDNKLKGFSSGGYATGNGDLEFTVIAKEDGLYDTSLIYNSDTESKVHLSKSTVNYPEDATLNSKISISDLSLSDAEITPSTTWNTASFGKIYLTAGANTIKLNSDNLINLDNITFTKDNDATKASTTVITPEQCELSSDAKIEDNKFASTKKVLTNIGGGNKDNSIKFKVNVDKAGSYKLSMFYSNNEPAPAMTYKNNGEEKEYIHPYNTDLVERYAQINVNGEKPQTVYFKNTLSWDTFKNVVMDINLKAGENEIVIYNDNSYQFSNTVASSAPNFEKFEITPSHE